MKKKTKLFFYFLSAVFAVLLLVPCCDMELFSGGRTGGAGSGTGDGGTGGGGTGGGGTGGGGTGGGGTGGGGTGGGTGGGGSGGTGDGGSGYDSSVPSLTIAGLPANMQNGPFSDILVYNSFGNVIAVCADYSQIKKTSVSGSPAAKVPLAYTGGGPFGDSGSFIVFFSVSSGEDSSTQNNSSVVFTDGSGVFDYLNNGPPPAEPGFFSGGLRNPSDTAAPVIKSGTKFEMNGSFYAVSSDADVVTSGFSNSCFAYIYVRVVFDELEFFYSSSPPVYDFYKKGFYRGLERALYKFVFIRDSPDKYFAKTFINGSWDRLRHQTVGSGALSSQNLSQCYSLQGAGNPQPDRVTLPPGAYIITLNGAAGGSAGGTGGAGGAVSEAVIISQNTAFTFFAGERGVTPYYTLFTTATNAFGSNPYDVHLYGGAGGGSGSFAFSPDGYFLCAGGGGGGPSNHSDRQRPGYNDSGIVPGGAGGSVGGGSAGSTLCQTFYVIGSINSDGSPNIVTVPGGSGGGLYRGAASGADGSSNLNIFFDMFNVFDYSYSLGFDSDGGSKAAYFNLPPPFSWLNTNNANGKAGDRFSPAQAGGNNRNAARGGGSAPSGNTPAGNGSVAVYRVNFLP
jgi:hypothetical protein